MTARLLPDMARSEYDAIKAHNFSSLRLLARSPAAYRYWQDNPPSPDSDAMLRGRLAHLAVLEPERLASVVIWDGRRAGREWESASAAALAAGTEIAPRAMFDAARAMGAAARRNPDAARLLADARTEATLTWADAVTGLLMRGRLDAVSADGAAIIDLKTTRDASPDAFGKSAWASHYHVQAAIYVDGYKAATGREASYYLLAVEAEAPHVSQVYEVEDWLLDVGRDTYRAWLHTWKACDESGVWPGYFTTTAPQPLRVPRWALPDELREDGGTGLDGLGLQFGGNEED